MLPNFATPLPGTLREVLDNDTISRDKISLNGLGVEKCESVGAYIILKTGIEVDQDYTIFQLRTPNTTERLKVPR